MKPTITRLLWRVFPVLAAICLASSPALAETGGEDSHPTDDTVLFAIIDQSNSLGIAMGRIATERGQSGEVRTLGKTLAADHDAIRRKLRELALKLGIPRMIEENELGSYSQMIRGLQAKPASEFDAAFLQQEIVIAKNTVDALKTNLGEAKIPEAAALARSILPEFERHVEATAAATRKLGAK
jgi:predicted outer membrane protein